MTIRKPLLLLFLALFTFSVFAADDDKKKDDTPQGYVRPSDNVFNNTSIQTYRGLQQFWQGVDAFALAMRRTFDIWVTIPQVATGGRMPQEKDDKDDKDKDKK